MEENDIAKGCDVRVREAHDVTELVSIARDNGWTKDDLDRMSRISYDKKFDDLELEEARSVVKDVC